MATQKGTNGTLLSKQYAEDWNAFVKERDRKQDWHNWLWGTHINKSKVAHKLEFSIDVFDDNPRVDTVKVEKKLIKQSVIDHNAKSKVKEKAKLSRIDSARLNNLEESSNSLRTDLHNLMAVLMRKQHEITIINSTLPEQKNLDLNALLDACTLTTKFDNQISEQSRIKEAELVNVQLQELKFICQMWINRLDIVEDLLSKSLRVPLWL